MQLNLCFIIRASSSWLHFEVNTGHTPFRHAKLIHVYKLLMCTIEIASDAEQKLVYPDAWAGKSFFLLNFNLKQV